MRELRLWQSWRCTISCQPALKSPYFLSLVECENPLELLAVRTGPVDRQLRNHLIHRRDECSLFRLRHTERLLVVRGQRVTDGLGLDESVAEDERVDAVLGPVGPGRGRPFEEE